MNESLRPSPASAIARVGTAGEPVHLYAVDGDYHGGLPAFYDPATVAAAGQLAAAFEQIRDEVVDLLDHQPSAWTTNFTPGGYQTASWRTLNLATDRLRYHRARRLLPRTTSAIEGLDGLATAQVGIIEPGCELAEHHGDTNVMHRIHLGLVVPGTLPDLGISVAGEHRGWADGEVLVFEDAHRHAVWNRTDHRRIILVVDVVKDELRHRQRWLCALAGSGIVVQLLDAKVPGFRSLPHPVRRAVHLSGAAAAWLLVPVQRRLGALHRS